MKQKQKPSCGWQAEEGRNKIKRIEIAIYLQIIVLDNILKLEDDLFIA